MREWIRDLRRGLELRREQEEIKALLAQKRKLPGSAFKDLAVEFSRSTPERLEAMRAAINARAKELPGIRIFLAQVKEHCLKETVLEPPNPAELAAFKGQAIVGEMEALRVRLSELGALAAKDAVEAEPEAFGVPSEEDLKGARERLQEVGGELRALYPVIGAGWRPEDIRVLTRGAIVTKHLGQIYLEGDPQADGIALVRGVSLEALEEAEKRERAQERVSAEAS